MKSSGQFIKDYVSLINKHETNSEEFRSSEALFIAGAKKYADSQGWSYAYTAFQKLGIEKNVLDKAGISDDGFETLENKLISSIDNLTN